MKKYTQKAFLNWNVSVNCIDTSKMSFLEKRMGMKKSKMSCEEGRMESKKKKKKIIFRQSLLAWTFQAN